MIKLLQTIWERVSSFLFPDDYYAWQTFIYLGLFSFVMSWVARLAVGRGLTVNIIATGGWIFFALGIGWLLEQSKVRLFGLSVAPWVTGAIICVYVFGLLPGNNWPIALMTWPLVSVAVIAIPYFLTWELQPKLPSPPVRQQLILFTLLALLFSNWFQFYFRLQSWFQEYPSLLADDFDRSGFVMRLADKPEEQARGIVMLTAAEAEISEALNGTPWPYVERWLLGLDERLVNIESRTIETLVSPHESEMWQLQAQRDMLENGSYVLDLMAVWSGPASTEGGYHITKTCVIHPQTPQLATPGETPSGTQPKMAEVECELATPRHPGRPLLS
ncbi:MAG: DUF5357 family protein [Leptolyngbyaceae cyanobacterium]